MLVERSSTGKVTHKKMTKKEISEIVLEQLSYDMNCPKDVFETVGVTLVEAGDHPKRRKFTEEPMKFGMLTFGSGTVMSARAELLSDLEGFKSSQNPLRLFEHFKMTELDVLLKKNGFSLTGLSEFYLPDPECIPRYPLNHSFEVEWYHGDEVAKLFVHEGFDNALSYYIEGLRPDVIAITAKHKDEIVGMAGASADGEMMWQVGIDVIEGYRHQGIAVYLVSELTRRILELGKVPYYGTWNANIGSRKIAIKCGYMPAWTEVY